MVHSGAIVCAGSPFRKGFWIGGDLELEETDPCLSTNYQTFAHLPEGKAELSITFETEGVKQYRMRNRLTSICNCVEFSVN